MHSIKSPRKDLQYAVVDMDGRPRSWHRTEESAQRAIEREVRRFHRLPGTESSYLPRSIVYCQDGDDCYIERTQQYSTEWEAV